MRQNEPNIFKRLYKLKKISYNNQIKEVVTLFLDTFVYL